MNLSILFWIYAAICVACFAYMGFFIVDECVDDKFSNDDWEYFVSAICAIIGLMCMAFIACIPIYNVYLVASDVVVQIRKYKSRDK